MKKIMVINLGTTSFKFKLFDFDANEEAMASGGFENIGSARSAYRLRLNGRESQGTASCPAHADAFELCVDRLQASGVLGSMTELYAVGYKAVHGGPLSGARIVDGELLAVMESFVSFAPAHNPMYIGMMRSLRERYPELKQVASFETSFHATIPLYRAVYGVPYEWMTRYGIRRYGFHGASHSYIARKMGELAPGARRVISAHLGGSSSMCAILDGKSVATSMGATPQSGLFNNNRVGDFDVFCLPDLVSRYGGSLDRVMEQLATAGGFLGLSGVSNDLRVVLAARDAGDARADLAVRAFADSIVGYAGMYTAYLGGLDALVFTGGIGQHSAVLRRMVCDGLGFLRLRLDSAKNEQGSGGLVSATDSGVSVWVLETNEEIMVARAALDCLEG